MIENIIWAAAFLAHAVISALALRRSLRLRARRRRRLRGELPELDEWREHEQERFARWLW